MTPVVLLAIQVAGVTLVMFGTLVMYAAFCVCIWWWQPHHDHKATEEDPNHPMYAALPVITDAFREWPLAGGLTTGLGVTLMCSGLTFAALTAMLHPWIAWSFSVSQASVWGVILSSDMNKGKIYQWVHVASTFLLMASLLLGMWLCLDGLGHQYYVKQHERMVHWFVTHVFFPAAVCGLLISMLSVMLGYSKKMFGEKKRLLKTALALGELVFVAASGTGFWAVIYLFQRRHEFE